MKGQPAEVGRRSRFVRTVAESYALRPCIGACGSGQPRSAGSLLASTGGSREFVPMAMTCRRVRPSGSLHDSGPASGGCRTAARWYASGPSRRESQRLLLSRLDLLWAPPRMPLGCGRCWRLKLGAGWAEEAEAPPGSRAVAASLLLVFAQKITSVVAPREAPGEVEIGFASREGSAPALTQRLLRERPGASYPR